VSGGELTEKVQQMSEYLSEESIAAAMRIPVEMVRGILKGEVSIDACESETAKQTLLHVSANPVYRQRIISVWRGRGGAGCTSVALHLAYVLEQMMSVLLVDLCAGPSGSDIGYYLRLPGQPGALAPPRGDLAAAVVQAESGLWVLTPPASGSIDRDAVSHLAIEGRKSFDTIIFDLPNTDADHVLEAVTCSNALVMVTRGLPQEMNRVAARKSRSQKETILVANGCPGGGVNRREYDRVVEIPEDRDLTSRMDKGVFHRKGYPLTVGAEKIRDRLFGMHAQEENVFRKAAKMFLGGRV
jgi:Mrp family chromosome partitioning ATPase